MTSLNVVDWLVEYCSRRPDEVFTSVELKDAYVAAGGKRQTMLPNDYCYNWTNRGIAAASTGGYRPMLERLGRDRRSEGFRYRGLNWGPGAKVPVYTRADGVDEAYEVISRREITPIDPLSEEADDDPRYREGKVRLGWHRTYGRSRKARAACILLFRGKDPDRKIRCVACQMAFGDVYGETVEGMIEVHHIVPLSELRGESATDSAEDLVPVCPNCHRVLHCGTAVRTVGQVQAMMDGESGLAPSG